MATYSAVNYHSLGRVYARERLRAPFVPRDRKRQRRSAWIPSATVVPPGATPTPVADSIALTFTSAAVPSVNLYEAIEIGPGFMFGGDAASENLMRYLNSLFLEITGAITTSLVGSIGAGFEDASGGVIAAGSDVQVQVPYAGTIVRVVVIGKPTGGSIEFDVQKATYNAYPTMTSIVASAPPEIILADRNEDVVLNGWNKAVVAGDIFRFVVTSAAVFTEAEISLTVVKT